MNLEPTFELLVRGLGYSFTREYKFHPTRRWRFDFADPVNKVAIELEGGIWIRGRHVHPTGYLKDTYKYNAAVILGWRVLRYCSVDDLVASFEKDYLALI